MNHLSFKAALLAAFLLGTSAPAQQPARARLTLDELSAQIDQVASQVKTAGDELRVVETQYTQRPEFTPEGALIQRFASAEIQYLVGDYPGATVLFYDLISDPGFRSSPRFADALYYLAESLHQQNNDPGALLYLKEMLALKTGSTAHRREALVRYLELSGRLNQYDDAEQRFDEAQAAFGDLPPALAYARAKWLYGRGDLPKARRLAAAEEAFTALARSAHPAQPGRTGESSPVSLQADYFLGVISAQRGDYPAAIARFRALLSRPAEGAKAAELRELANLSLGRLLFETGRLDEALDRYQEIPRQSENFVPSLYEIAWIYVRREAWEKARSATDLLLLVDPDSLLAPDARILQAHALLKLRRYREAGDAYDEVSRGFGPARDQLDGLLAKHAEPAAYFDNLLARHRRSLDAAPLLPPVAVKWARVQPQVARAFRVVDDLGDSRQGVDDAQAIAGKILDALEQRGAESFPALQEGQSRAESVGYGLSQADRRMVRIEGELVDALLTPAERTELERRRADVEALAQRLASVPTSGRQMEARRRRMQASLDALDRNLFKLGYELISMQAMKAATEKFLQDTRGQRRDSAEAERAFLVTLEEVLQEVAAEQREQEQLRASVERERALADASAADEEVLRAQLGELLQREHAALEPAEGRLASLPAGLALRAHRIRQDAFGLRDRIARAKETLRQRVAQRGEEIHRKVQTEQRLLRGYSDGVTGTSGRSREVMGEVARDSVRKVRTQFYDLVLRAEVGGVDVAFTRKQDQTQEIQRVSAQKDQDLRALDEEFKEVLKDVD